MTSELEVGTAMAGCQAMLGQYGLRAVQVDDLTLARELLDNMGAHSNSTDSKGPYVTRWLDPKLNHLSGTTSFWVFLVDEHDAVIGKTGNRIDHLGRESFGRFAMRSLRNVHRDDETTPRDDRFPSCADALTGSIAYCGDTFVSPDFRTHSLPGMLLALNYLIMSQKWGAPDWTLCFLRAHQARRWKWTKRYWRWHIGAADFSHPASSDYKELWFGMLSREGFWSEVADAIDLSSSLRMTIPAPPEDARKRCVSNELMPAHR